MEERCCGRSPEVESNTRWSSVWRQAVKEQCCLDNCDAVLMIIAKHLTDSSPHTNTHTMYVVLSKCALHVLDVSHFSPKHYYYIILNNNKPSVQPLMVVLSLYQHRCKRAFWPKVDFLLSPLSFSSLLPWDTTVHHSPKEPASYRTGEHIWSSRQAICSPEPQWDLINTATVDRGGECGCCGLPALTGIMDQLFGHSGLIVPAAWPLWFLLPHLFVSTLLIKELGSRIP